MQNNSNKPQVVWLNISKHVHGESISTVDMVIHGGQAYIITSLKRPFGALKDFFVFLFTFFKQGFKKQKIKNVSFSDVIIN